MYTLEELIKEIKLVDSVYELARFIALLDEVDEVVDFSTMTLWSIVSFLEDYQEFDNVEDIVKAYIEQEEVSL